MIVYIIWLVKSALHIYVLSVFKVFCFQFSAVNNILKNIYRFTETTD